jgi:hypothetical protein
MTEHLLSTPNSSRRGGAFVVIGTVLLTGLAAGALCCLLALMVKLDPAWLMLPFAVAIGAFVRWQNYRGARGAIIAVSAMLLSLLYTEYLYAAVRIADMRGFPLRDTLFKMDWTLAWQIIAGNFSGWEAISSLLAPFVAMLVTVRTRRTAR